MSHPVRGNGSHRGERARPQRSAISQHEAPARRVIFALFDGCEVMDVAGPMQAFHEAGAFGHHYVAQHAGVTRTIITAQGLEFTGLARLPDVGTGDRVIVPGYPVQDYEPPRALVRWLRDAFSRGAHVCSVCTGAFVLGEAGLLDGRRCTTHWRRVRELQSRFPHAVVLGDHLFVEDGRVVTSAGIAAGVDMALALLERDHGAALASSVAREMVVYLRRDATHHQQSVYLDYLTHLNPAVHLVQQFLVTHPRTPVTLRQLARKAGMSERNLTRLFRQATGISIHQYRQKLRLQRATDLIHNPSLTLDEIAAECGFADARQLRRLWKARFGRPPRGTQQ